MEQLSLIMNDLDYLYNNSYLDESLNYEIDEFSKLDNLSNSPFTEKEHFENFFLSPRKKNL